MGDKKETEKGKAVASGLLILGWPQSDFWKLLEF